MSSQWLIVDAVLIKKSHRSEKLLPVGSCVNVKPLQWWVLVSTLLVKEMSTAGKGPPLCACEDLPEESSI